MPQRTMTDCYLLRSALDRFNGAQEEVTASPEIFRLEEYPLGEKITNHLGLGILRSAWTKIYIPLSDGLSGQPPLFPFAFNPQSFAFCQSL